MTSSSYTPLRQCLSNDCNRSREAWVRMPTSLVRCRAVLTASASAIVRQLLPATAQPRLQRGEACVRSLARVCSPLSLVVGLSSRRRLRVPSPEPIPRSTGSPTRSADPARARPPQFSRPARTVIGRCLPAMPDLGENPDHTCARQIQGTAGGFRAHSEELARSNAAVRQHSKRPGRTRDSSPEPGELVP